MRNWKEVILEDLPNDGRIEITDKVRKQAVGYARAGDARYATGRFLTDSEVESYRERVLSKPMS